MLKIGDSSSLSQVSIKTLRYYDERGLLSPVHVDAETGYDSLLRWVASNGYHIDAPIRELYLHSSMPVPQDDGSYVTEIQVPVRQSPSDIA
jgi:MerR family regulatory protein